MSHAIHVYSEGSLYPQHFQRGCPNLFLDNIFHHSASLVLRYNLLLFFVCFSVRKSEVSFMRVFFRNDYKKVILMLKERRKKRFLLHVTKVSTRKDSNHSVHPHWLVIRLYLRIWKAFTAQIAHRETEFWVRLDQAFQATLEILK